MKKSLLFALVTALLLTVAMPMTVFAHGHSGRSADYPLCTVEDCAAAGTHQHAGTNYAGHTWGDGHDYHQVCAVEGCARAELHEHDGTLCFPHSDGDGHGYHRGGGMGRHH